VKFEDAGTCCRLGNRWDRPRFTDELRARQYCRLEECGIEDTMEHTIGYLKAPEYKPDQGIAEKENAENQMCPRIGTVLSCELANLETD
jgi:hypothetical protein